MVQGRCKGKDWSPLEALATVRGLRGKKHLHYECPR